MDGNRRIQLLDATLRDGGFGLEDAQKNEIADIGFKPAMRQRLINDFQKSKMEIIELGGLEQSGIDKRKFEIYETIEEISNNIPPNKNASGQKFAAMFRGPDIPLNLIPDWKEGLCDATRLIVRYSEIQKSLEYCRGLVSKGYKVFIQPMLTMRYTKEELAMVIREANDMKAYAVYFVDSYGYMNSEDVIRFTKFFDENLNPDIHLGFHSHNNMNLAFSNVQSFLAYPTKRNIIVDSCLLGMGQGAGNMQTEILSDYLNQCYGKNYDYEAILDACESIESFLPYNLWGYSVTTLLPSLRHIAYKYAIAFRNTYKLTYVDIYRILNAMPENMRQRYTKENAEILISKYKK